MKFKLVGNQVVAYEDKLPGGIGDKKTPADVDPEQLKMGIKVEMEHTKDEELAKEIAIDHLTENPKYYTDLKKIEPEHFAKSALTQKEFANKQKKQTKDQKVKDYLDNSILANKQEETMSKVLTEKEATVAIATLQEAGLVAKVTRVAKDGFVVKAEQSHNAEDDLGHETVLPEEKGADQAEQQKTLNEQKATPPVIASEEEKEDEAQEELSEDEMMDFSEATAAMLKLMRNNITATVVAFGDGKYAIAMDEEMEEEKAEEVQPDPENPELETTEEMKSEDEMEIEEEKACGPMKK